MNHEQRLQQLLNRLRAYLEETVSTEPCICGPNRLGPTQQWMDEVRAA